ncbi:hypothetical protein WA026_020324 [Henosepilachna vigintioctopunctata]|uniref:RNA helicase n=1 Tax=Henosepilachna vigintioctopunctata TaxID=420089 RepID=A0AAW1TXS6_9CUCU
MLKFLESLIWGKPPLSLDEAYTILEESRQDKCNEDQLNLDCDNIQFDGDYSITGKKGYITSIENGVFIIDREFKFTVPSDFSYFHVGSKVMFDIVLSKNTQKVLNVTLIENDWDVETEKKLTWCLRTVICKVIDRLGRQLVIEPGDIGINLDEVASDFVPIVGDWIQLEAKCELDENVVDLCGKILEIHKIAPLRPVMKLCSVSSWDPSIDEGILDNSIYFTKDCLLGCYIPLRGDKVVAEIIESDQKRCALRALKVVPDYMKPGENIWKNVMNNELDVINNKVEGISIEKPNSLIFNKLKESLKFSLLVKNDLEEEVIITEVKFLRTISQCKIVNRIYHSGIASKGELEIKCECLSMHIGKSIEYLLISTSKGDVGDFVEIIVKPYPSPYQGSYQKRYTKYKPREQNNIIKGQNVSTAPRFIAVKCPDYTLPKRLLNLVTEFSNSFIDTLLVKEQLATLKPCLNSNLTFNNYLDKFHTLLYLEEIQNVVAMSVYDQDKALFIRNNEYLMLEIENLSEKRPSVIVGDKVYAKDPYGNGQTDWEGFVHKVGAKHIYIKFSPIFHDNYNDEDYEVHIVSSRTTMRRLHQAVDLAVRNLGLEILFPTKVDVKMPQINFKFFEDKSSLKKTDIKVPKTGNNREILKKILEYGSKSPEEKEQYKEQILNENLQVENMLKIEWYNKDLNFYQQQAVKNIILGVARPLPYIIFGPPGTGKTVTLVECILQILRLIPSSRLLVAAPSNSAADLIALRLIKSGILRPGDLVRYVSHKYSSSVPASLAPFSTTGDLSLKGTNARAAVVLDNGLTLGSSSSVLGRHRITVVTCSSAGALYTMGFPKGHFSHIMIDEAGQAMEPEIMIPLAFLDKQSGQAILAGDPMQLGPVILSKIADDCGLQESFVERLLNRFPYVTDPVGFPDTCGYDPRLVTKLLCNYRSMPSLLKLTSCLFYKGDLIPMISDENEHSEEMIVLEKLSEILIRNKDTGKLPSIIFHGVNGENFQTPDSPSWFNPCEASQVFFYINDLYRLGLKSEDVGVISPYVKQVKEIRNVLVEAEFELPRIGSVEEFQGQEFNVVILSTVRSNQEHISTDLKHGLGFISSHRRVNVALSRAKLLLIIIGNPNLLYGDKCWQSIIDYTIQNGNFVGCNFDLKR